MTTLVALNTMDGIVLGCDSLGTMSRQLVDPFELAEFFEEDESTGLLYGLKMGTDGKPLLNFKEVYMQSQDVPYNHMTLVDKLLSLAPLEMGVMFAGISAIGDRTIKSIIEEFRADEAPEIAKKDEYTVAEIGDKLMGILRERYAQEYPPNYHHPELELMVGGYDAQGQTPCIVRMRVDTERTQEPDYDFAVHFGAQRSEIARLIFGTDAENQVRLEARNKEVIEKYHDRIQRYLDENNVDLELPGTDTFGNGFSLFSEELELVGLNADWGGFSIPNAIECVDFLVNIMIRSHQFKEELPSVAGPAQIGVIQKNRGFTYVSERVWRHEGNVTQIKEN